MAAKAADVGPGDVESTAIAFLAMREHSRFELRRKLARQFHDEALVGAVLDDLETRNLLSDQRFAESYVDQRSRKGFGPLRIRAELSERGVDNELIAELLDERALEWRDSLREAASRKFGDGPASDRRELARRSRFLQQRGFPTGLIGRYLDDHGLS